VDNLLGLEFRASVILQVKETKTNQAAPWNIYFKSIKSDIFEVFEGNWTLSQSPSGDYDDFNPTQSNLLTYSVDLKPNFLLPVLPFEWKVKANMPINLNTLRTIAEASSS
jgi:hypothetical protein